MQRLRAGGWEEFLSAHFHATVSRYDAGVVSRIFVIVIALGAAAYQFTNGDQLEALGLLGLGTGLIFLKAGETRPQLRHYAYLSFLVTAIVIGTVIYRNSR